MLGWKILLICVRKQSWKIEFQLPMQTRKRLKTLINEITLRWTNMDMYALKLLSLVLSGIQTPEV